MLVKSNSRVPMASFSPAGKPVQVDDCTAPAAPSTGIRDIVENTAGAIGSLTGRALYTLPAGLAGMSYGAGDRYREGYMAGPEAVTNLMANGIVSGVAAGATLGAMSHGLLGAAVGGVGGFLAGTGAGFALLATQHFMIGRDYLDQKLGDGIRKEVDSRIEQSIHVVPYQTHDKVAAAIKGLRGGLVAGNQVGAELGRSQAKGAISGLIDGLAGVGKALTYEPDSASDYKRDYRYGESTDQRSIMKKILGVPLGVVNGVSTALLTLPAGAVQGLSYGRDGFSVKAAWAFTAVSVAAVAGAFVGDVIGVAALGAGLSILTCMSGWKRPSQINERMSDAVLAGKTHNYDLKSSGPAYSGPRALIQGPLLGGAAALNAGFHGGYYSGVKLTDGLCDLTSAGLASLGQSLSRIPEAIRGLKDGLK